MPRFCHLPAQPRRADPPSGLRAETTSIAEGNRYRWQAREDPPLRTHVELVLVASLWCRSVSSGPVGSVGWQPSPPTVLCSRGAVCGLLIRPPPTVLPRYAFGECRSDGLPRPAHPYRREFGVVAELLGDLAGAARPPNRRRAAAMACRTCRALGSSDRCDADTNRASACAALMLSWSLVADIAGLSWLDMSQLHHVSTTHPVRPAPARAGPRAGGFPAWPTGSHAGGEVGRRSRGRQLRPR
jgi:hypothetical protein